MIASKVTATFRLEAEFKVIVGELRVLEDDLERMTPAQILEVYGPEMEGFRVVLHLTDTKKEKSIGTGSKGKKKKENISTPIDS